MSNQLLDIEIQYFTHTVKKVGYAMYRYVWWLVSQQDSLSQICSYNLQLFCLAIFNKLINHNHDYCARNDRLTGACYSLQWNLSYVDPGFLTALLE